MEGLPDPGQARSFDDVVGRLRSLKVWAGDPSYDVITTRINVTWSADGRPAGELARRGTVADCFKLGRRRLNVDLVIAVVRVLHPDDGYVAQWRQALRVVGEKAQAAAQVRAQDTLPDDLVEFTGRDAELRRLHQVLRRGVADDGAVVVATIEGMAGVGKTQLAIHAGHLLDTERPFEQVLFVNLRGFGPDPAQPPADPAAVLDSFLRLLGVPGQQIPHDLTARAALYRQRLAGRHTLVVLDNAATEAQVRPLLPGSPGSLTLITSRRSLAGLQPGTPLSVDVFHPDEAIEFLNRAAPDVAVGDDPYALERITRRCGYLPLALGLMAGHMRAKPGWTVTDHADRLDERHHRHRLEDVVELALDLSYQHLPADRRRMFRLLAMHPGNDLDAYSAAALTGADLGTAGEHLEHLYAEHLLRQTTPGRYVFHDLVRAYAAERASDEDRPSHRRAALTRLFDHYLHTAATAMDTLYPAEQHRRPRIPPSDTPAPPVADSAAALAWLEAERTNLTTITDHAAGHGWPEHNIRLAAILWRYFLAGGDYLIAAALHTQARQTARDIGDRAAEARALNGLGLAHQRQGRYPEAIDYLQQSLSVFGRLVRAWTDNDAAAYGACFTEDCDYVSYDGTRAIGRADMQYAHDQLFRGVLAGSALVGEIESIRYLMPGAAVVHGTASVLMPWRSTLPKRRLSRQTLVAVRTDRGWLFAALHNGRVRPVRIPAPDSMPSRMAQMMGRVARRIGVRRADVGT